MNCLNAHILSNTEITTSPAMLCLIASLFSQPKSMRYKFVGQLRGLKDYVYMLALSHDGVFLASGGE